MAEKIKFGKKKLLLLISMFVFLAVGVVVGLVVALPKGPDFDVQYSSLVHAEVSAKYEVAGKEVVVDGAVFDPNEGQEQKKMLYFGNIKLESNYSEVKFTYSFLNKDTHSCVVAMYDNSAKHNVEIRYEVYLNGQLTDLRVEDDVVIPAGAECSIVQYVKVHDLSLNAYYQSSGSQSGQGSLVWHLFKAEDIEGAT